jgi:pimeloyl-ACP methyl ester carboxylesterase
MVYDSSSPQKTASKVLTLTVSPAPVATGNLTVTVRRSDTNALLSGATVTLSVGPSSPAPQTTGGDGTTTFSNLTVGNYTVMAGLAEFKTNSASATVVVNTPTSVAIPLTPTPQQAKKRVVILVHGIAGYPGSFGLMADFLRSTGKFEVFYFNYHVLSNAGGVLMNRVLDTPIQDIATYFKVLCINNIKKGKLCASPGQDPDQAGPIGDDIDTSSVDIVAHSMGGLVALSYISGLAAFPYENDVGKVVTLGTPFFGGHFSYLFGWAGKQVEEMEFASQFLWDLQQAWKNTLDLGRYKKTDILNVVGTLDSQAFPDSDTVVPVVSAVLPDLDIRSRYVPKCHATIVPNCSNEAIASVDTESHPSYKLVESFLLPDRSDPQNCPECSKTPPTTTGSLFVRFVEKDDPTIGIPVSEYADDKVLTFDPDPNASLQFDGRARGTLLVQGLPAQSYTPTVDGRKFYREVDLKAPRYVAPYLPPISINAGRTTVLPQIELWKTESNYTVMLAVAKAAWVAGKDIFDLAVQLCCTIPTAQSNDLQGVSRAAEAQSSLIDGYIWTEISGGGRFFLMPDFTNFTDQRTPVVSSFPIQNFAGSVLSMPIPADLPTGTYTFFAVGVVPGSDPLNSANWVTNRAELAVTLTQ